MGTIIFYLLTLTLKFDLHFINFNIDHIFWMASDGNFILHMCLPFYGKPFLLVPKFLTSWPWSLTYFSKTNIGHNFWMQVMGLYISLVCSLWQALSSSIKIFDLLTLTLKYDLLFKNFNLGYNFWMVNTRAFYFICMFLMTRHFHGYHNFLPLDLEVWPTFQI